MSKQALNALNVIAKTPHIRAYLEANDPKALEQVEKAIPTLVLGRVVCKNELTKAITQMDEKAPEVVFRITDGRDPE